MHQVLIRPDIPKVHTLALIVPQYIKLKRRDKHNASDLYGINEYT